MSLPMRTESLVPNQSIYYFTDYKEYLRHLINTHRRHRGYQGILARAAGCKPAYFSGVIRSKLNLSSDQIMGIAIFLRLDDRETEYFLTILALVKTQFKPLKTHLEQRLVLLREGCVSGEFSLDAVEFKGL